MLQPNGQDPHVVLAGPGGLQAWGDPAAIAIFQRQLGLSAAIWCSRCWVKMRTHILENISG